MKKVSLSSLIGLHTLTAVEYGSVLNEDNERCNTFSFTLGGKTYTALEDPQDGYRSCMQQLTVSKQYLCNLIPPTRVLTVYGVEDKYTEASQRLLWFYSVETGKVVLEVGTDWSCGYYPTFVANFRPRNLPCNTKKDAK